MTIRSDADAPVVSVVLPTYGRPTLVCEAVASVNAQTYTTIELLVVDDCSPTPIEPAIAELTLRAAINLRVIRHDENKGANVARNTGIRAASGEYVAFLDDDDRWEPTKLERQVERLATTDAEVVYVGQRFVNDDGETTRVRTPTASGAVTEAIYRGAPVGPFSTLLVTAAVIERAGLPDERFPAWQDREWHLRLSQHGRYEPIPEPLTIRRIGMHGQIDDDADAQHEAAELYLDTHRSLAASYGRETERKFLTNIYSNLAGTALGAGRYRECARRAGTLLRHDPRSIKGMAYLIVGIGGPRVHRLIRSARECYRRVQERRA